MSKKVYLIDIDGTICDDIPNEESEKFATAEHFPDALETINKWYDDGHVIYFFTARESVHKEVTETWLKEKGFNYHGIIMDKPRAVDGEEYHWIDNKKVRATTFLDSFTDLVTTTKEVEVFKDEVSSEPLIENNTKGNVKDNENETRKAGPPPAPSSIQIREGEQPRNPDIESEQDS